MSDNNSSVSKLAFVVISALLGVIAAIGIGLSSFSLYWTFEANAQMRVMAQRLDTLSTDKETDEKQDLALSKHWRLHSWARDEINGLRTAHNLPISPWPDLPTK